MSRGQARSQHAANLLVGGTGLVYAWMRYVAQPADEFAIVNHPWQPQLQHLHVLTAPLLVFVCGWIWSDHVWKRVCSGFAQRRTSGLFLFALFAPMVATGYLLQTSTSEAWRAAWIWAHGGTSVAWIVAYMVHQLSARGPARQKSSP